MKRFCYGWILSIQFCGGVQAKQNKISYVGLSSTKLGIILIARPRSSNGHIPSVQRTIKTPTPDCKGIRSEMHQFLATERRLSTDLWASPLSSWSYGIESACLMPSQLMVWKVKFVTGQASAIAHLRSFSASRPVETHSECKLFPSGKISVNIHQKCIQMISRWYDQKLFLLWKWNNKQMPSKNCQVSEMPGLCKGAHDRLKHLSWELFTATWQDQLFQKDSEHLTS